MYQLALRPVNRIWGQFRRSSINTFHIRSAKTYNPINMGTLYLVSTPIGNMEDITLRALSTLRAVSLICAEDTRTTRKLLSRHNIKTPVLSYNEHNMKTRTPTILAALQRGDAALVSEAGTPTLSDPGYELVAAAIDAGVTVVSVPGPSALLAALAASGLPARQFTFLGFLPRRPGQRRRLLDSLATEPRTIVVFEAPHRLRQTLAAMLASWGDRRIAVCRELTKLHEEIFRGRLSQAIDHFREPRGEFTLVIEGAAQPAAGTSEQVVRETLRRLRDLGLPSREAVRRTSKDTGLPQRQVYAIWIELSREARCPPSSP